MSFVTPSAATHPGMNSINISLVFGAEYLVEEHQRRKQYLAESLRINNSAESLTKGSVVLSHSTANNVQNEKTSAKCTENTDNVMPLLSLDCLFWAEELMRSRAEKNQPHP